MYIDFNPEDENLGTTGIRGTGIYVKDGLCSIGTIIEHTNHEDQVWIEITLNKQDNIISTTAEICNILRCAIAGDFNLSGIDWGNDCVQNNQEYLIQFVNTIHDCFLFHHVKKPTRYREGETPNEPT